MRIGTDSLYDDPVIQPPLLLVYLMCYTELPGRSSGGEREGAFLMQRYSPP
jgi:hypothetical protein